MTGQSVTAGEVNNQGSLRVLLEKRKILLRSTRCLRLCLQCALSSRALYAAMHKYAPSNMVSEYALDEILKMEVRRAARRFIGRHGITYTSL